MSLIFWNSWKFYYTCYKVKYGLFEFLFLSVDEVKKRTAASHQIKCAGSRGSGVGAPDLWHLPISMV